MQRLGVQVCHFSNTSLAHYAKPKSLSNEKGQQQEAAVRKKQMSEDQGLGCFEKQVEFLDR